DDALQHEAVPGVAEEQRGRADEDDPFGARHEPDPAVETERFRASASIADHEGPRHGEHDQVDHADIAELQAVVVVEREDPQEDDDLADPVERRVVECAELAAEPGQSRDAAVEDVEETAEQDEEAGPADLVLMEREARTECGEEAERREKIR